MSCELGEGALTTRIRTIDIRHRGGTGTVPLPLVAGALMLFVEGSVRVEAADFGTFAGGRAAFRRWRVFMGNFVLDNNKNEHHVASELRRPAW